MNIKETFRQMMKDGYSIDDIYDAVDDFADEVEKEASEEKARKAKKQFATDQVHAAATLMREAGKSQVKKGNEDEVNEFFSDEAMDCFFDVAMGLINGEDENFFVSVFSDLLHPENNSIKVKKCDCKNNKKLLDIDDIIQKHLKSIFN